MRRKLLKQLPRERLFIEHSQEYPELREIEKAIDTIDDASLVYRWLSVRFKAAGLGLFVDWSEPELDQKFSGEWRSSLRRELSELSLAIRNERNERWRFWEIRLKVITAFAVALTGVLGAAIGLIATLKN